MIPRPRATCLFGHAMVLEAVDTLLALVLKMVLQFTDGLGICYSRNRSRLCWLRVLVQCGA